MRGISRLFTPTQQFPAWVNRLGGAYVRQTQPVNIPRYVTRLGGTLYNYALNVSTRFNLGKLSDVANRFGLSKLNDLAVRFGLGKLVDIAARFRLQSANQLKDLAVRFRLQSANKQNDVVNRYRISFLRDIASRLRLGQLRDISVRFLLASLGTSKKVDVVCRFRMTFSLPIYVSGEVSVSRITAISAILARLTSIRSNTVATPNTSIQSTITVSDVNGSPVSTLSACSVTVKFPDGTSSSYSLLAATIVNIGSGQYQVKYNTKGVGLVIENWTVTAADGLTVANFQYELGVGY